MYSRKADCELFYDSRESIGSTRKKSSFERDDSSFADHYNPTLRLLQIPRSSNGSVGFHLTRSKWDPYPWINAVDKNTPARFYGLKVGDCVLEVNGEDVLGMRVSEIADLVNCETKSIDNVALLLWNPGSDINCNPMNLCCGPMPLNLERLTALTQTILAIIECPVCLETIVPPILQCQNGHILCVKCRILSHTCPVCRQHFHPGRCLVAEQIYNSIMGTFNLRSPDESHCRDGQQLFGAKYKRSSSISMSTSSSSTKDERRRRREKQQHNSIRLKSPPPHEVNKFESQHPSTNKFLAKLLGRAYSMDNLSSPYRRQSASLLSMKRITIGRVADDNVGGGKESDDAADSDDDDCGNKANSNSDTGATDSYKQLEFGKLYKPRPTSISKQLSVSVQDLSKKDNDGLMAIQHEYLSKNRLQYLGRSQSVQMALLPILPLLPAAPGSVLGRRKLSVGSVKYLKDGRPLESTIQISCCTSEQPIFFCPLSCGKHLSGPSLQKHIKVDHCAPILCYNSSSAELALPLRAPLDEAAVLLLMCDGKDFWIKLRTHGEENITALALFQGPEDESSDFMMETRLRIRPGKDQEGIEDHDYNDDDDGYVKIVVNNENRILERELISRSIVRSMNVTEGEDCSTYADACREFLYNQEDIRMTFGTAIDYQNISLKISIKRKYREISRHV